MFCLAEQGFGVTKTQTCSLKKNKSNSRFLIAHRLNPKLFFFTSGVAFVFWHK
ncbi:hypothetical protein EZS27_037921, partial [termite gut metagenome]